jgi:hypothetical protein
MLNLNKEELDRLIAIKTEEKEIYFRMFGYYFESPNFLVPVDVCDVDEIAEMYGLVPIQRQLDSGRFEYFIMLGGVIKVYDMYDKELDKSDIQ